MKMKFEKGDWVRFDSHGGYCYIDNEANKDKLITDYLKLNQICKIKYIYDDKCLEFYGYPNIGFYYSRFKKITDPFLIEALETTWKLKKEIG